MEIHIGTSGWSYGHWKGRFYPEKLAKSHWFHFYAKHFNTVEINATFYRRFQDKIYHKWREQAPDGFLYVLKVPRLISHQHQLNNVAALITEFCRTSRLLEEKLGLLLLQLPPKMAYKPERLNAALCAFDNPSLVTVEFRAQCWLTDEVFAILEKTGANYCNPDYPEHELTAIVTGDYGYLRLHGRRQWYADNYHATELKLIADTAKKMEADGAKEVFIFFNNDYEAFAPANAIALLQLI